MYDLRFDPSIDPEYYSRYPGINRAVSVFKLLIKYFVLSTFLTLLAVTLWNYMEGSTGWPLIPIEAEFKWSTFTKLGTFWYVASGLLALLIFWDFLRCLVSPIRVQPGDLSGQVPLSEGEQLPIDAAGHWDVFISYKSEDVEIARRVANQLMASGLKVWFAEYQVLLQNYDQFQEAINHGIDNSDWGIALTNNRYAESVYCSIEISRLLERLPPQNILEIMIPEKEELPHRKFKGLAQGPSHVGADLTEILAYISKHTGWQIQLPVPVVVESEPRPFEFLCMGRSATLDIRDWKVSKRGRVIDGSTNLVAFEYLPRCGQYRIFANVVCGPELAREGQRQYQASDDRKMYEFLMTHAKKHLKRLGAKIFGLHLVYHNQLSQLALTYRMHGYWTRKYSLVFPNQTTSQNAEFVFTFGFKGSFNEYCLNVHNMDHFVQTLKWN